MDIKFWNQPKEVALGKILCEKLEKGFDQFYLVAGVAKDSGIEILLPAIESARKLGTEMHIAIGLDRKNISKDMLLKLLELGCHLYLHINRDDNKVETRIYVLESRDKVSYIYSSSGKFSEDGLSSNLCLVQEIAYLPEERKLFENAKSAILVGNQVFQETDREELKLLAEKGEIVARITERKIPSISEMYGNTSLEAIANDVYDETSANHLFEIPKNDFDIDIDIAVGGEVKKAELSAEVEAKKEKVEKETMEKLASEKLSKYYETEEEKPEKKATIIKDLEKIDFSNVSILVLELNKMAEKGVGEGEIKIPLYLLEEMKPFFERDKFGTWVDKNGKEKLGIKVMMEVVDVSHNETIKDEEVCMYEESRYLAIKSPKLNALHPNEKDIVRLIKNEQEYHLELIRKDSKEYEIWNHFCIYTMKNSKRKFGIM